MTRKPKDDSAFVELIHEHQGIVHRICAIYESSRESREDLFQEIVMQCWRSFDSFRGRSKFSTWLYRVGLNTAALRLRKNSRERQVTHLSDAHADQVVCQQPDDRGDLELLYRCIHKLPSLNRAIILLYLERRTYEEMAEITGLTRSNISVRLVRIKAKLRELMLAEGVQEV